MFSQLSTIMEESLASQFDSFFNNTLELLDTTTERDYMQKLKFLDDVIKKFNKEVDDIIITKKALKYYQDECNKLNLKLQISTSMIEKEKFETAKLKIEIVALKSQLDQIQSIIKKPNAPEIPQTVLLNYNCPDNVQLNKNINLDDIDSLVSDLSYSHSEDSLCGNVIKSSKLNPTQKTKNSKINTLKEVNTKTCKIQNMNINGGKIVATNTLTMSSGRINAKLILKTQQSSPHISDISSCTSPSNSLSFGSLSDSESQNELKPSDHMNIKIEKKHRFSEKIIVIPEDCGQCLIKIKFNNYRIKCMDCKIIAHLECKDLIPAVCTLNEYQIDALNCGIPPLIVHCISQIEIRGLDTDGLYRVSSSDKEVKMLRDKFRKAIPNLHDVDIHILSNCLKNVICSQKNSLLSLSIMTILARILINNNEVSKLFCQVILDLPSIKRSILAFLILHLQKVASSPKCNMNYDSLAKYFGTTIIGLSINNFTNSHIKYQLVFKIITELLKLPQSFWILFIKSNSTSSDEHLHNTPARNQPQTSGSESTFRRIPSSSGLKRRILDSPNKCKLARLVDLENKKE